MKNWRIDGDHFGDAIRLPKEFALCVSSLHVASTLLEADTKHLNTHSSIDYLEVHDDLSLVNHLDWLLFSDLRILHITNSKLSQIDLSHCERMIEVDFSRNPLGREGC